MSQKPLFLCGWATNKKFDFKFFWIDFFYKFSTGYINIESKLTKVVRQAHFARQFFFWRINKISNFFFFLNMQKFEKKILILK